MMISCHHIIQMVQLFDTGWVVMLTSFIMGPIRSCCLETALGERILMPLPKSLQVCQVISEDHITKGEEVRKIESFL